jgi:L-galactose dehydrogenase/L-glyceraldehyde 3-phosphate reductase
MQAAEMGVHIRVLAAGALSGTEERHPLGSPPPAPIGSGADYRRDVERARRFEPLVREGHADSLIEAATSSCSAQCRLCWSATRGWSSSNTRRVRSKRGRSRRPPLDRVADIQRGFVGEPR